ncbi:hypothetical protein [Peribacillus butanolivorans]|uniref:hypothetical protein n=1 Tax=Peribacillus butanolivorans TaxID=421767 RepID=UPI00366D7890
MLILRLFLDIENINGFLSLISKGFIFIFTMILFPFLIFGKFDTPTKIFLYISMTARTILFLIFLVFPVAGFVQGIALKILEKENLAIYLWNETRIGTKLITIVFLSLFLSIIFYQYGYTVAQEKDNYLIYKEPNKDYVLLDKDGKTIIISQLLKGKNGFFINKNELKIVQIKSESTFKNQEFKNGLKVKPNERAEKLSRFKF